MQTRPKRSVRTVWFISYLAVLLIPAVASLLIYFVAIDALNRQTQETNRTNLQLLEQQMESSVEYTNRIADTLLLNRNFAAVRNLGPDFTAATRFQVYSFVESNMKQFVATRFISGQFLYLRNSNLILTNNAYQDAARAQKVILGEWAFTDEAYGDLLESPQQRTYMPMQVGATPSILYAQSLSTGGSDFDATLVVAFSRGAIISVLDGAAWSSDGFACVLNSQGEVLLESGDTAAIPPEAIVSLPLDIGENDITIEGHRYICFNTGLKPSGLRYLYAAPYGAVYQKSKLVQALTMLSLTAAVLFSMILIVFWVRRHYSPLDGILESLSGRDLKGNEYEKIRQSIELGKRERIELRERLDASEDTLGRELLSRFLLGRMPYNANTYRLLSEHGIALDMPTHCVVCLKVGAGDGADALEDAAAALFMSAILELAQDMTAFQCAGTTPVALVFGVPHQPSGYVLRQMQAGRERTMNALGVALYVGLSDRSDDTAGLPNLYRQADAALEFALMNPDQGVARYPHHEDHLHYYFHVDDELMLLKAVRDGNVDDIGGVMYGVYERYAKSPNVEMARCLKFDLIATCYRVFAYADGILPREVWYDAESVQRMEGTDSIAGLVACVRGVLSDICGALQAHFAQHKDKLSDQIRAYVEAHWPDPSLSVASIAETFGMHASHVSRTFKLESGIGLLEHINRYRVDQSIPLLRQGEPVGKVAEQCGFANDASYIRVFKQYIGVTPGVYRDSPPL